MVFKKWVKSIQTAGYNGARTVDNGQKFELLDSKNKKLPGQNIMTFDFFAILKQCRLMNL